MSPQANRATLFCTIGEGNDNPLQCSCLENSMDEGAWWATVRGVAKKRTRLSDFTHHTQENPKWKAEI